MDPFKYGEVSGKCEIGDNIVRYFVSNAKLMFIIDVEDNVNKVKIQGADFSCAGRPC